jgi:lipocalin-like protein
MDRRMRQQARKTVRFPMPASRSLNIRKPVTCEAIVSAAIYEERIEMEDFEKPKLRAIVSQETDKLKLRLAGANSAGIEKSSNFARTAMSTRAKDQGGILPIAFVVVIALLSGTANAQDLKEQVVGTWTAVSQYVDQDGKKLEPFGSSPKGIVVYDSSGHFVLVLQRATLPKFASNNRLTGTPEENRAIVQGSIAYFGRYSIDEKERKMNLHYDGSTYPNWDGEDQTRLVEISGDELKIVSPVSAVGGGTVHLLLRRAK